MLMDIRTKKGKLVGKLDKETSVFSVKDGGKTTLIDVPSCGLSVTFVSAGGAAEKIHIPSPKPPLTAQKTA